MSKINAIRLINLNYNNNAIRVGDEVFHLNGESTLFSLRNGGGKSVLVQMIMAPFVHKRYREAKDRPFASYFTTAKPTFILVEWKLEHGAGYVLTGMMVRRNQDMTEEIASYRDELEIINFISEYKERCNQDIFHLPVVEKTKKEMVLKNFGACRQLFESYKKDRSIQFFYYDMSHSAQSKQYFDKLSEYQIFYKEWEAIIKKVNLKESGLSDLFSDCRDEKGLVEKWFLEAVESKLNKEKNRMKEFQNIVEKYVGQYKENKSKIERRDTIAKFEEQAAQIRMAALSCQEHETAVSEGENQIAGFSGKMEELRAQKETMHHTALKEAEEIRRQLAYVNYEKLSKEYYVLKEAERFHSSNRDMIEAERDAVQKEWQQVEGMLHRLHCAKQQEQTDEEQETFLKAKERLAVAKQQEEDLEPERKSLGRTLFSYYECEWGKAEAALWENEQDILEKQRILAEGKEQLHQMLEDYVKEREQAREKETRIKIFDAEETKFNRRYEANLARNILGEYEAGSLEVVLRTYEREQEQKSRERTAAGRELEISREKKRGFVRGIEEKKGKLSNWRNVLSTEQKKKQELVEEIIRRKTILRYLELPETDIFEIEKIRSASARKMAEIERAQKGLEQELHEQQKEYIRLTQGRVLELPPEFQEMLEHLGIHYVYGMEWLKKNGNTAGENKKLVEQNPFLPYALILSKIEMEKLLTQGEKVCTSIPIPLIVREELAEKKKDASSHVIAASGIHFYVLFNENLLDEENLRRMALEKENRIQRLTESISRKKQEYDEYFARQECMNNQKLSRDVYLENENMLAEAKEHITQLESETVKDAEELSKLEEAMQRLEEHIHAIVLLQEKLAGKMADFEELRKAYGEYQRERKELLVHQKEASRLQERRRLKQEQQEKLESAIETLRNEKQNLLQQKKELEEKRARYLEFAQEGSAGELNSADLKTGNRMQTAKEKTEDIFREKGQLAETEARYEAITSRFSMERRELEAQLADAGKRLEKARAELLHLSEKYGLEANAWSGMIYSRAEERHQESVAEGCRRKKEEKDRLWNKEDKELLLLMHQLKEKKKKLEEECGTEEPLAKDLITTEDFEAQRNQYRYELEEKQKHMDALEKRIVIYEATLTTLAEFTRFTCTKDIAWEENFDGMSRRELDFFRGELVNTYRESRERRREAHEKLSNELNRVVRMECFAEDFYRKPLESLIELSGNAKQVLLQLETTVQSYHSLMEKLEVDISMIRKEKEKIVELLYDYLHEVHTNLGQIDQNSTITIREKPVKMLKILLPSWDEGQALYQVRLQDFMDEMTRKGIEIFERNENAAEFFGTRVTTKNLYDTVVGISNVQIRLYKVEEQREYAITWAEVAKNSGGEGFLSAFVVLSSLLYYMRRDESDIFADKNEGKVLVMDNPFAQTNAAHLLKPLMDMAKKANTQLICLSGLGGESIYHRFDNIYVLNLIAASLRGGMQYLRADHARGAEVETMIVSQIEVVEQQELIF